MSTTTDTTESGFYDNRNLSFITDVSLKARTRVFELFYKLHSDAAKIIDVGVTGERASEEANFFEKMFPEKERITAAGVEDASFLEMKYPGLKFVKIVPNQPLPFPDNAFDVTFSHAVVEHVTGEKEREFFINELVRVSRNVFITTPNKFFPVETHTKVPLLHFLLPGLFYFLINRKIVNKFYNSSNLRLLSKRDFCKLLNKVDGIDYKIESVRTLGFTSNLVANISKRL